MQMHETEAAIVADDNYLSHVLRTLEHVQNEKREGGGGMEIESNARSASLQNLYEDAVQLLHVATEEPLSTGSVSPSNPNVMMKRCAQSPMGCGQVKSVTQFAKRITGPPVPFHVPSPRDYSIVCGECLARSDRGNNHKGVLWDMVAEAVNQARKLREQMPDVDPLTMGVPGVNDALVLWQRNGGLCAMCRDPLPGWATRTEREPSAFAYVEWIARDKPPPSAWGAQVSERWSPPELIFLHASNPKRWCWIHSSCAHPQPSKEKLKETSTALSSLLSQLDTSRIGGADVENVLERRTGRAVLQSLVASSAIVAFYEAPSLTYARALSAMHTLRARVAEEARELFRPGSAMATLIERELASPLRFGRRPRHRRRDSSAHARGRGISPSGRQLDCGQLSNASPQSAKSYESKQTSTIPSSSYSPLPAAAPVARLLQSRSRSKSPNKLPRTDLDPLPSRSRSPSPSPATSPVTSASPSHSYPRTGHLHASLKYVPRSRVSAGYRSRSESTMQYPLTEPENHYPADSQRYPSLAPAVPAAQPSADLPSPRKEPIPRRPSNIRIPSPPVHANQPSTVAPSSPAPAAQRSEGILPSVLFQLPELVVSPVRSPAPNPTLPTFHAPADDVEEDEDEDEDEQEEEEEEDDSPAENEQTQNQPSRFGARISLLPRARSERTDLDPLPSDRDRYPSEGLAQSLPVPQTSLGQQSFASDTKNNDDEFPFVDVSYEMEEILPNSQVVEMDPKGNALFPLFPGRTRPT